MAPGPIAAAQEAARALLTQALLDLNPQDCPASPVQILFSPDGTGGDLASPYAQRLGTDPALLAQRVASHPFFTRCYPNWGWIAFDLSEEWWQQARSWQPDVSPLPLPPLPPIPDFPARICPESWRINTLLGRPQLENAARLDRGNPAVLLQLARRRALRVPSDRSDRARPGGPGGPKTQAADSDPDEAGPALPPRPRRGGPGGQSPGPRADGVGLFGKIIAPTPSIYKKFTAFLVFSVQ